MNYDYRLGQLEQAVISLTAEKAELQRQVASLMIQVANLTGAVQRLDRGPDPRLWAGDAHDPYR